MNSPYNHINDKGFLSSIETEAKLTEMKNAADKNQESMFWQALFFLMPCINAITINNIIKSHPSMNRYKVSMLVRKWYCLVATPLLACLFWIPLLYSGVIIYQQISPQHRINTQKDSTSNSSNHNSFHDVLILLVISTASFVFWRLLFQTFNKDSISYGETINEAVKDYARKGSEDIKSDTEEIKQLRKEISYYRSNGFADDSPEIRDLKKRLQKLQDNEPLESNHVVDDNDDLSDDYPPDFPLPK